MALHHFDPIALQRSPANLRSAVAAATRPPQLPTGSLDDQVVTWSRESLQLLEGRTSFGELAGLDAAELEAIYARGYAAWEAGDLDAATADFGLLAIYQPRDRRFLFAFACALKQQGELLHALKLFGYAAAMQANDPFASFHIAECLLGLDEVEAARDALDAVIALCYGQAETGRYDKLLAKAQALLTQTNC